MNTETNVSITSQGKTAQPVIQPYAWVILVVAYVASVAAPLTMFKVAPLMPILMAKFNMTLVSAGALMSVFAITGFLLAVPAGLIMQKLGLKTTGLIAMGCLVIGSVWGAYASTSTVLLMSRFVEGAGMGLIAVVAPASIAMWFPPQKIGMGMGIWGTWIPTGTLLTFALAPVLAKNGYQPMWWFSAAVATLAFILVALFLKMPSAMAHGHGPGNHGPQQGEAPTKSPLASSSIWLLAGCGLLFSVSTLFFSTFYITFMTSVRGYTMPAASMLVTFYTVVTFFAPVLAGLLSDKLGSRKKLIVWGFVGIAAVNGFTFNATGLGIYVMLVCLAMVASAVPPAMFAAAPEVMGKPQLAGLGMGMVSMGQNLGMFIAPVLFGAIVGSVGWITATYWMIPIALLGAVVGWFIKVR